MGVCVICPKQAPLLNKDIPGIEGDKHRPKDPDKKHKQPVIDERNNKKETMPKEAATALISSKPKDEKDIALILNALKSHFLFSSIDKESQLLIIKKVKWYEIDAKELIFQEGQPGECFFVVSSGKLEVKTLNRRTVLGPGESFGEYALLDSRVRTATIRTLEPSKLWGLHRIHFMNAIKKIRKQEYEENKQFINSVSIFSMLTRDQKEALLGACVTQKRAAGEVIIKEGDTGDMFFIVKEGMAICNQEKTDCREIHKGDYFGEHALLYQLPRLATVIAATEVKLISIGRKSLLEVLGNHLEYILYRNSQRIALERSIPFKSLSSKQRESILDHTKINKYHGGEIVIRSGTVKSSKLWIVVKGKLTSTTSAKNIETLECLGDEDLANKTQDIYEDEFISVEESDIAEISVEDLERCIGGEISEVTIHNDAMGVLRQVQLLRGLSVDRVNALTLALKIVNFEDQEVIVQQNNPGHSFFIIKSGSVKVYKNEKYIRNVTRNDYFGERSVLFNDFRTATVIAEGSVSCWSLEREDFMNIISENIREQLIKRIELQDTSVMLDELIPIRSIGTGALGNIILTIHKQTKLLYALKSLSRGRIEKYQIHSILVLERNILMQLDHVMIIKVIKTFKDRDRVYFLLEYVRGKDLFDILVDTRYLSEGQAKFYTACLILTLEYLHERCIIHRDLKPENVMIDNEGYTKLIDFAASTIVDGRTYTSIGTPHYLAPEIILRTGYSFGVDWWALGILLHEMAYGFVPFGEDDEDPILIYEKILEHRLELKDLSYKCTHLKEILIQLLNKNPAARTCGGFTYLKSNKWFMNFNWDRLMSRQLRNPSFTTKSLISEEQIEDALANPTDIDTFLREIENKNADMIYKKRTQPAPSETWDENF